MYHGRYLTGDGALHELIRGEEKERVDQVNNFGQTMDAELVTGDVTTSIGITIMYGKSGYTENHPSPLADPASSWKRLFVSLVVSSTAKLQNTSDRFVKGPSACIKVPTRSVAWCEFLELLGVPLL